MPFSFDESIGDYDSRMTLVVGHLLQKLEAQLHDEIGCGGGGSDGAAGAGGEGGGVGGREARNAAARQARPNFETHNRPQNLHMAPKISEWTSQFPHIRVRGVTAFAAQAATAGSASGVGGAAPGSRSTRGGGAGEPETPLTPETPFTPFQQGGGGGSPTTSHHRALCQQSPLPDGGGFGQPPRELSAAVRFAHTRDVSRLRIRGRHVMAGSSSVLSQRDADERSGGNGGNGVGRSAFRSSAQEDGMFGSGNNSQRSRPLVRPTAVLTGGPQAEKTLTNGGAPVNSEPNALREEEDEEEEEEIFAIDGEAEEYLARSSPEEGGSMQEQDLYRHTVCAMSVNGTGGTGSQSDVCFPFALDDLRGIWPRTQ